MTELDKYQYLVKKTKAKYIKYLALKDTEPMYKRYNALSDAEQKQFFFNVELNYWQQICLNFAAIDVVKLNKRDIAHFINKDHDVLFFTINENDLGKKIGEVIQSIIRNNIMESVILSCWNKYEN